MGGLKQNTTKLLGQLGSYHGRYSGRIAIRIKLNEIRTDDRGIDCL